MTPTTSLAKRAERAVVYANGARARKVASRHKARTAINLVALALIYELRKSGHHVSRKIEQALRG